MGDPFTFGEAFDAVYNGQNILLPFDAEDTNTYTITCTVDLNGFDYAAKTGGTITIDAVVEEPSDVATPDEPATEESTEEPTTSEDPVTTTEDGTTEDAQDEDVSVEE
jgi:hypothetical protein